MNDNIGLLINSSRGIIYASKRLVCKEERSIKTATGMAGNIV
jgi:hypothetical protein